MPLLDGEVTPMNVSDLKIAVSRAAAAMADLEQTLNQADAKLGDGDTGGMLARVIAKMDQVELEPGSDLGAGFAALARAALSGTGSSLGTLFATGLMSFAKAAQGKTDLPADAFSETLAAARDAMLARGGACLGDKTVIDAIDAIVRATEKEAHSASVADAARRASAQALLDFRDQPCKVGRARMFGEKSVGIDDPGMLAVDRLTRAITAE